MESEISQMKLDHSQKMNKQKDDMVVEFKKRQAEMEMAQHDQMNEKNIELKELQQKVLTANESLDRARIENANKLEQQQEEERLLREKTIDNMNVEFKKREKEYERRLTNKDARQGLIFYWKFRRILVLLKKKKCNIFYTRV